MLAGSSPTSTITMLGSRPYWSLYLTMSEATVCLMLSARGLPAIVIAIFV